MDSSDFSDGPITLQEYLEVKKALASSEAKVQQLMKVNNNLSEELRRLQKEVRSTEGGRKDVWAEIRQIRSEFQPQKNNEYKVGEKVEVKILLIISYLF